MKRREEDVRSQESGARSAARRAVAVAAGVILGALTLPAQTASTAGSGAQVGVTLNDYIAEYRSIIINPIGGEGTVTGSPMSANQERKSVQTLGDGTTIERSSSDMFYRDSQGRTRLEQTVNGQTHIIIWDAVAGFRAQLDPAAKTARKAAMAAGRGGRGGGQFQPTAPAATGGLRGGTVAPAGTVTPLLAEMKSMADNSKEEDLGMQTVNGVPAQGTRTTLTIPAGQIGNNRDIHVVNERWYSSELQMMVKTVNTDPRYGVSTFQLTNISRAQPDSRLFQIPPEYTVTEMAGRGAVTK
jgi:hypothetical protein